MHKVESGDTIYSIAKKYKTEIVAENMQMGPRRANEENKQTPNEQNEKNEEQVPTVEYPEDEINPNAIPF